MNELDSIEWHDLPLESIQINHNSIELTVSPFDENTKKYTRYRLKLSAFASVDLSIESMLLSDDLLNMEISKFDYSVENSSLSGTIGVLPKNAGYWTISFKSAQWDLSEAL